MEKFDDGFQPSDGCGEFWSAREELLKIWKDEMKLLSDWKLFYLLKTRFFSFGGGVTSYVLLRNDLMR